MDTIQCFALIIGAFILGIYIGLLLHRKAFENQERHIRSLKRELDMRSRADA